MCWIARSNASVAEIAAEVDKAVLVAVVIADAVAAIGVVRVVLEAIRTPNPPSHGDFLRRHT